MLSKRHYNKIYIFYYSEQMTTFPESKMTKMTLTKMTACYVFSELFLCGVKNKL